MQSIFKSVESDRFRTGTRKGVAARGHAGTSICWKNSGNSRNCYEVRDSEARQTLGGAHTY